NVPCHGANGAAIALGSMSEIRFVTQLSAHPVQPSVGEGPESCSPQSQVPVLRNALHPRGTHMTPLTSCNSRQQTVARDSSLLLAFSPRANVGRCRPAPD